MGPSVSSVGGVGEGEAAGGGGTGGDDATEHDDTDGTCERDNNRGT